MSVIFRPAGEEIASYLTDLYNVRYLDPDALDPKPNEKYDVLCSDGLNYVVDVKSYDKKMDYGHFHFVRWPRKSDYQGSFTALYLAREGSFSKLQGISSQNYYPQLVEEAAKEAMSKHSRSLSKATAGSASSESSVAHTKGHVSIKRHSMPSVERYPDDYLSKPRAVVKVDNLSIDGIESRPSTRAIARVLGSVGNASHGSSSVDENPSIADATNEEQPLNEPIVDTGVTETTRPHAYSTRPPKRKSMDDNFITTIVARRERAPSSKAAKARVQDTVPSSFSSSSSAAVTGQSSAVEGEADSTAQNPSTAAAFLIHARMVLDIPANIKRTDKALEILRGADKIIRVKQARDILQARRSLDCILLDLLK
jgi:hypothetical protein